MMRRSFTGNYPVTREFGIKDPAYANYPGSLHPGTDYGLPANTPLEAGMSGIVTIYDRDPNIKTGRGKEVKIELANFTRKDCHLNRILVTNGQFVKEGQPIGLSGSTGYSTGPHLHSELLVNGQLTDLEEYLKGENVVIDKNIFMQSFWSAFKLDQGPKGRQPTKEEIDGAVGREFTDFYQYWINTTPIQELLTKGTFYDQDVKGNVEDAKAWRKFVKDVAANAEEDI
jgi:murein DD-endopeptidase MepM/ murein hydrolase activator NlpD